MPNGGAVKLTIDTDKVGYVRLPNGGILETVDGGIDTTYTGVGGAITYYVPKIITTDITIRSQLIHGNLVYNGSEYLKAGANYITGLIANNTTDLECGSCPFFTDLQAKKVVYLDANTCALTAKSIGDILYQAYIDERENVVYDFSGGTNASEALIETYFDSEYGLVWSSVYNQLVTVNGGTITLNL